MDAQTFQRQVNIADKNIGIALEAMVEQIEKLDAIDVEVTEVPPTHKKDEVETSIGKELMGIATMSIGKGLRRAKNGISNTGIRNRIRNRYLELQMEKR